MTIYAEDRDLCELSLETRQSDIIQFWQWREKGGQDIESAKTYPRFLNFEEQAVQEQSAAPNYGLSFTTLTKREEERTDVIPKLEGINANNPAITSTVRNLLRDFWAIVVSKAMQTSLPIDKTSIAVFNDLDEDRTQVVLRVLTGARASQAVAFWEGLDREINEWVSQLNDRNRLIFMRDISLRIHWK